MMAREADLEHPGVSSHSKQAPYAVVGDACGRAKQGTARPEHGGTALTVAVHDGWVQCREARGDGARDEQDFIHGHAVL